MRYSKTTKAKLNGVVYTPKELADYLAYQMHSYAREDFAEKESLNILDPASGKGELLISLIDVLHKHYPKAKINIDGYEIDPSIAQWTQRILKSLFPYAVINIYAQDFISAAATIAGKYDFIIANPPYIRTQMLGSEKARLLAERFGISGRVDAYYAFLVSVHQLLADNGVAGFITSNKFLSIKSGNDVRNFLIEHYNLHSIVDFGDTKLFEASVLPCTIIFSKGKTIDAKDVKFTSIYEKKDDKNYTLKQTLLFENLHKTGEIKLSDGRFFNIEVGCLNSIEHGVPWNVQSAAKKQWIKKVESNTWQTFSDIGKIKVGIKTTADNVFIGSSWDEQLELLRPLITHRDAGKIKSSHNSRWQVLYPHEVINGKKCSVNLEKYPHSQKYLLKHYDQLVARKYILEARRNWYEIWVPQNPDSWKDRKIVFRDIADEPQFWLDETGAIVNGDCYWIDIFDYVSEDMVYLALAVANSAFIKDFYDARFNTKLYSGKRRFMSQYVEQFPLPYYKTPAAQAAISEVKKVLSNPPGTDNTTHLQTIDHLVEMMFGVNEKNL